MHSSAHLRPLATWFALGLMVHGLWALSIPQPLDWDPAYYSQVARNILAGQGAVVHASWHALWPAEALPLPADLHWMPLPSRVLLPGLAVWPAHGDQLITVLLAACWAPLAWSLAAGCGAQRPGAHLAAALALCAGGYTRFLSTPDSIALYGVLGAAAWLCLQRRHTWALAALCMALALTRTDGALLGLCLAFGLWRGAPARWPQALAVAAMGPLAVGLWWARNHALMGDEWLLVRQAVAQALSMDALVAGQAPAPGWSPRLMAMLTELSQVPKLAGLTGVFLLPWPVLAAAWARRRSPIVQAAGAYALLMPLITVAGAPAVAGSGTPFRSGAALFVLACAMAGPTLMAWARWTHAHRGYPRALVPALFLGGFALGSLGLGALNIRARPPVAVVCSPSAPPDGVHRVAAPLQHALACGGRALPADAPAGPAKTPSKDVIPGVPKMRSTP